jgi:hypothetical protein
MCTNQTSQQASYNVRLVNNGSQPYTMTNVCLKLWLNETGTVDIHHWGGGLGRVYSATGADMGQVIGTVSSTQSVLSTPCTMTPGHYANQEITYCIQSSQIIPARGYWVGQADLIQVGRDNPAMDNGNFADDYSHLSTCPSAYFVDSPYYALYSNGRLVWETLENGSLDPQTGKEPCVSAYCTPTPTTANTRTVTATPTNTITGTPTRGITNTPTVTKTVTSTRTSTVTATGTPSGWINQCPSCTPWFKPPYYYGTPTVTVTQTPSATATVTTTKTGTPIATVSSTPTSPIGGSVTYLVAIAEPADRSYRTPVPVVTETPTVSATPDVNTKMLSFVQARPNVSNGTTPIRFHVELNRSTRLTLSIFNLNGRLLYRSTAVNSESSVDLEWNIRTTSGNTISSGLYVFSLKGEDPSGDRKGEFKMGKILIRK